MAAAEVFVRGGEVDWAAALPRGGSGSSVDLPTYAFDHRHYWLAPARDVDAVALGQADADHPLLGAVVSLPDGGGLVFTSRLSPRTHPWLADHTRHGVPVLPAAGLVELAVRAGDEAGCGRLRELTIDRPLLLATRGGVRLRVTVGTPAPDGARPVAVHSSPDATDAWTRHASGLLD
ncbi:polyketide synthase dehydratase domain-containing protein, partial [Frankia sp. AgKG'84/4]|nr:polyketide synthase dehydratase domain-containing protein [Frankia sp. AgKG'84/4]